MRPCVYKTAQATRVRYKKKKKRDAQVLNHLNRSNCCNYKKYKHT